MASNCHVKVNPETSMCQPRQNGVAEFRESLKEHTTPFLRPYSVGYPN